MISKYQLGKKVSTFEKVFSNKLPSELCHIILKSFFEKEDTFQGSLKCDSSDDLKDIFKKSVDYSSVNFLMLSNPDSDVGRVFHISLGEFKKLENDPTVSGMIVGNFTISVDMNLNVYSNKPGKIK